MKKIYTRARTIQEDKVSGFCPGCMHSTVIKLIGEVLDCLMRHDFDIRDLNAIVSRSGLLVPIHAGAYENNDAMALNVAKNIAKLPADVCGKVDAILLTGSITYSDYIDEEIRRRVSFIAPVIVYPGEDEMQSLAFGCLRVLHEESARTYTKVE